MFYLFLDLLRSQTTKEEFIAILDDTDNDIKVNRIHFGKTTNLKEYIKICSILTIVTLRSPEENRNSTIEIMHRILNEIYKSDESKQSDASFEEVIKKEYQKIKNQEGNYAKHIN
ncbi:hypothetical protein [Clostridium beijerinckii]|uniref:Uncharacterized protein n=1 Tax=Clostridium beijerinckii TaxID=1520 RepID=A0AAE5H8I6_CLOBE|nr:hypothetical protein [Clostridium beijerinckii]NSB15946.1 hypothetical protein [Clostridium beijerinckii]OOM33275.1 hypothetical protein CLOBE_06130 [Clostridium beijerinckii]